MLRTNGYWPIRSVAPPIKMGIEGNAPTTTHSGGRHAKRHANYKGAEPHEQGRKERRTERGRPRGRGDHGRGEDEPRTASPAPKPAATVDMQIVERFKPTVSVTVGGTEPTTATCQHPYSHITRNVGVTCARNLARGLGAKLA